MAKGRVDFYIPDQAWGLELLHDGDKLAQHSGRFSQSESYATLPLDDYIILDCRTTHPMQAHRGMLYLFLAYSFTYSDLPTLYIPKLYHVVFSNNFRNVSILDNTLKVVDGGEFVLLASSWSDLDWFKLSCMTVYYGLCYQGFLYFAASEATVRQLLQKNCDGNWSNIHRHSIDTPWYYPFFLDTRTPRNFQSVPRDIRSERWGQAMDNIGISDTFLHLRLRHSKGETYKRTPPAASSGVPPRLKGIKG